MSEISLNQIEPDADFWNYIACTKCSLTYSADDTLTIPFWLTECGHVVCNNHLKPDQTCACCGASNIQVTALQRQMDEPMADWFRSVPVALDTIAFAAKFQQETLTRQVRYYRNLHERARSIVDRLKQDNAQLRKIIEAQNNQIEQLKHKSYPGQYEHDDLEAETSDFHSSKRKRPMVQNYHQDNAHFSSSSPRSVTTPIGPSRITLPMGQQTPGLSSEGQRQASGAQARPGSSRQLQQYAYAPPDTGQYKAPPLTKTQAAPKYFQRTSQAASSNSTANAGPAPVGTWLQREDSFMQQQATHATGMHQKVQPSASGLPALSKFRPAGTPAQTPRNQAAASASRGVMQRPVMGPPPTPQRLGTRGPTLTSNQQSTGGRPQVIATPGSRRFVPPTVDNTGQRAQQVGPNQVSQGGRPMHGPGQAGSGQRMPFIPGVSK